MSLFPTTSPTSSTSSCDSGTCATTQSDTDIGQTIRPAYRVQETDTGFSVTVLLPGVTKGGLEVSADDGELTIIGKRAWTAPDSWTPLYRETGDASFQLTLSHDAAVNIDQVVAELRDGILTLTLPKSEALKPRKIAVA